MKLYTLLFSNIFDFVFSIKLFFIIVPKKTFIISKCVRNIDIINLLPIASSGIICTFLFIITKANEYCS